MVFSLLSTRLLPDYECLIKIRNCLPFASAWARPRFLVGFWSHPRLLVGFWSHPRFLVGFWAYPRILVGFWTHPRFLVGFVLLIFVYLCVVFCVLFVSFCVLYPLLPVSLDYQNLITSSLFSNVYFTSQ